MTRLERAREEWVAALAEERELITAELQRLGGIPRPGAPAAEPPQKVARAKNVKVKGKRLVVDPPKKRRGVQPPGSMGGPLQPSTEPKKKFKPCTVCGRDDIAGKAGPGPRKDFHYAAGCELPCAGGYLDRLTAEDRADGIHGLTGCPGCKKKA